MGDYDRIGDGLLTLVYMALVATPLALWKLVDIAIWLYHHINFSWT